MTHCGGNIVSYDVARPWQNTAHGTCIAYPQRCRDRSWGGVEIRVGRGRWEEEGKKGISFRLHSRYLSRPPAFLFPSQFLSRPPICPGERTTSATWQDEKHEWKRGGPWPWGGVSMPTSYKRTCLCTWELPLAGSSGGGLRSCVTAGQTLPRWEKNCVRLGQGFHPQSLVAVSKTIFLMELNLFAKSRAWSSRCVWSVLQKGLGVNWDESPVPFSCHHGVTSHSGERQQSGRN